MPSASIAKSAPTTERRAAIAAGQPEPLSLRGWLRLEVRFGLMLALLLMCLPLHYLYRVLFYGSPFPQLFLAGIARIVGARVERIGTPLKRDVFFVANHVSWIDILAMAGASGTAFVAKAEVKKTPLVGWLAGLNRTVYVQREDRLRVAEQINELREALTDNWSITVFPEGTTTDGHSLLPFKTSMLKVLEPPPPGLLVQPVLLDYGEAAEDIGWVGEETGLDNAKRLLARKGTFTLRIHFLEPFSPVEHLGRKAIAAEARHRIQAALEDALGKPLRHFHHDVGPVRYAAPKPAEAPLDS